MLLLGVLLVGCSAPPVTVVVEDDDAPAYDSGECGVADMSLEQRLVDLHTWFRDQKRRERPNYDVYRSTKLGNQITVLPTAAGGPGVRILEANILECEPARAYEPGGWVLTLRTDPTFANTFSLNPLLATVSMGTGAASTSFDVDVVRGQSMPIPAGNVTVTIALQNQPSGGISFPTTQLVTAAINRGDSTSKPTRTFFFISLGAAATAIIPVPPLAVSFFGFGSNLLAAGTTVGFGAGTTTVLAGYTGAQILASQLTGVPLPVPAGANTFIITFVGATVANFVEQLQFNLDI